MNPLEEEMRRHVRAIWDAAVAAAEPLALVREAVTAALALSLRQPRESSWLAAARPVRPWPPASKRRSRTSSSASRESSTSRRGATQLAKNRDAGRPASRQQFPDGRGGRRRGTDARPSSECRPR